MPSILVIFYCELTLFVMSAYSSNDTLHGDNSSINNESTLPAMTIKTLSLVARYCVVKIKESDIKQIFQLAESDRINIVDLNVFSTHIGHLFANSLELTLVNPIGREILSVLEMRRYSYVTWTLNAGRRSFSLEVEIKGRDVHKKCNSSTIKLHDKIAGFVKSIILEQIVLSVQQPKNYAFCLRRRNYIIAANQVALRMCCLITKSSPKWEHQCQYERNSLLNIHHFLRIATLTMTFLSLLCVLWLAFSLYSQSFFDTKYSNYYKLEKSATSPSSIVLDVIWKERGHQISFIRWALLIITACFLSYNSVLSLSVPWLIHSLMVCFGMLFPFFHTWDQIKGQSLPHSHSGYTFDDTMADTQCFGHMEYNVNLKLESYRRKIRWIKGVMYGLTSPFNLKLWSKTLKKLNNFIFASCVRVQFRNTILRYLGTCAYCLLSMLIFLLGIGIFFPFLFVITTIECSSSRSSYNQYHGRLPCSFSRVFRMMCRSLNCLGLCYLFFNAYLVLLFTIQSFLLGLLLNLISFIPYLALFSVLSFYSLNDWKHLEEKYFMLKRLIYEACRDIPSSNNGCIPSRHPKKNETVSPVVSKKLYDTIREELLPYNENLFFYVSKVLWYCLFAYGTFELVSMLQAFNISATLQVLTTASVSIVPHVFNMMGLKIIEERKKVWNEKLKLNVKYMVEKLTVEDPELARTVLIIQNIDDCMNNDVNEFDNEQDLEENIQYETSL